MSVRIQTAAFDISHEIASLTAGRADVGAVVTFTGLVRGSSGGQGLLSMTLEHYPGMTEAEMGRVETEAHARWPLDQTLLIHRVGTLHPGDPIVLVIATSRHRQAAFEAAEFLMDYLKSRAPFWKKETLADGTAAWVDARESDGAALERWENRASPLASKPHEAGS